MELDLLARAREVAGGTGPLQAQGGLALLDAGLQADRHWRLRLARASQYGLPLLAALLAGAADPLVLAERLQVAAGRAAACGAWPLPAWMQAVGRWHRQCSGHPSAGVRCLSCRACPLRWHRWPHLQAPVSGAELIYPGDPKVPQLEALLRQARFDWLDRECP